MDNKTRITILNFILSRMNHPSGILSKGEDVYIPMGIDVKDLHSLWPFQKMAKTLDKIEDCIASCYSKGIRK